MQFLDAVGSKSGLQRAQASNGAGEADDLPLPRKAKLELEKMELQLEEQTFRLQRDRGEWIRKDVVEEGIASGLTTLFTDLYRAFCGDLPAIIEGQPASKISKALKEEIDRISEHSHTRADHLFSAG